jgi:hypothetical protein
LIRAAAPIADGRPVDLGDTASGLDRQHLQLLLAALSHAGGSTHIATSTPLATPATRDRR